MRSGRHSRQSGSTLVEFALSFTVMWIAFLAVIEFSRLMLTWALASHATATAARLASICEPGVLQQQWIRNQVSPYLTSAGLVDLTGRSDWLSISYFPVGCTTGDTCEAVEVHLHNIAPTMAIPGLQGQVQLPEFRYRSTRETMHNSINGTSNATCS